jgi:hypothetical protein
MSTVAVIVVAAVLVLVLVFLGGLAATRRRAAAGAADYERRVAEADRALEQARASDRGWERGALEEAARGALRERWPDFAYDDLHLVLVDDRPGVEEDRAHFAAVGSDGEARVVLVREPSGWGAERVERA